MSSWNEKCLPRKVWSQIKESVYKQLSFSKSSVQTKMWNIMVDRHTHATGGCIVRSTCFAFQMTVANNTEAEYIELLLYYGKICHRNAPQRYVKRVSSLLFLCLHIAVTTSPSSNLAGHFPSATNNNHTHKTHTPESNRIICCLLESTNAIK